MFWTVQVPRQSQAARLEQRRAAERASGAVRILKKGAQPKTLATSFITSGFQSLPLTAINSHPPTEWAIDSRLRVRHDQLGNLRDIGTYEYDAIAAVGLFMCQLAPIAAFLWHRRVEGSSSSSASAACRSVKFNSIGNRDRRPRHTSCTT